MLTRVVIDADVRHAKGRKDLVFAAVLERILDGIAPQRESPGRDIAGDWAHWPPVAK